MKLYFGFTLFALLLCLSVAKKSKDLNDFNCAAPVHIPDSLLPHCPKLSKGSAIGDYLSTAVVEASLSVLEQCGKNVDHLCATVPELIKIYHAGGEEECKAHLQDHLCDHINHELSDIYCSYKSTLSAILDRSHKWKRGQESDLCKLFESNDTLCSTVTVRMCERIGSLLSKSYCHRVMKNIFC